ncbi:hypothetical protein K0M31_017982 [Melipona bicolor]|uniref:Uncharacterized protein n=1 Tax=Melipona bicolor TaxID=60889 RepID=A0AA40KE59_9HYME|nr:hypothetical protein K0M31_017982 [Melipona bicolor]
MPADGHNSPSSVAADALGVRRRASRNAYTGPPGQAAASLLPAITGKTADG